MQNKEEACEAALAIHGSAAFGLLSIEAQCTHQYMSISSRVLTPLCAACAERPCQCDKNVTGAGKTRKKWSKKRSGHDKSMSILRPLLTTYGPAWGVLFVLT